MTLREDLDDILVVANLAIVERIKGVHPQYTDMTPVSPESRMKIMGFFDAANTTQAYRNMILHGIAKEVADQMITDLRYLAKQARTIRDLHIVVDAWVNICYETCDEESHILLAYMNDPNETVEKCLRSLTE